MIKVDEPKRQTFLVEQLRYWQSLHAMVDLPHHTPRASADPRSNSQNKPEIQHIQLRVQEFNERRGGSVDIRAS